MLRPFLIALALTCATAQPSIANPLKSLYTTIDLAACRIVKKHADGNAWSCPGLAGYPVYFAEGDLRAFVSVGPKAGTTRAATQTLRPFNSIFQGKAKRATVEWRFNRRGRQVLPYATIMRYFTTLDGKRGQVLVVSHVSAGEVCHVAYIDALANPDAIALARKIADETGHTFACTKDPGVVGKIGRSPI